MKKIVSVVGKISNIMSWVSGIVLLFMALLLAAHAIGRYVFHSPIRGAQELVELSLVIIVYCAMPWAARQRRHLSVDAVTRLLHPSAQNVLAGVMELLCVGFIILLAVRLGQQSMAYYATRTIQTTMVLRIPLFPFYFFATASAYWLALEFFIDAIVRFADCVNILRGRPTIAQPRHAAAETDTADTAIEEVSE